MKSYEYIISTDKYNIDFINKVVEAYEGLAIIRTLDRKEGLIKLLTNTYFIDDINLLIDKFRKNGIDMKILEERVWKGEL
ncbi:DUF4911 domain-containing protein [Streptobacillus moniliformis]|uniref:DUF4911 domain-containing protein n=1 Tax=Streptobacillus moniliformis (strain ATCC 14647 / DSM 12112 / NCTC 10651 / 9901) TaxID=519441 RepID=D1AXG8_STRM9|nr:DUF4911 domain-containing protein [Streptobacillus moniliformis]ACZ00994.1 hypothetical protein Smon_0514 [Streptobacillus moniliformis DSM 12112]AVL42630.1 DUF4911 domain-containing protein [Streptobacillus moniliformis]QXW65783.1 DUF4911 domain-containing protein [Streptobacillus moniliformis]SQA13867.1 Uncharacterised protein [Streptobacillus moniliformis]SQA14902.1 Uncharacterised protein [Streptobacillus moniliformis]